MRTRIKTEGKKYKEEKKTENKMKHKSHENEKKR